MLYSRTAMCVPCLDIGYLFIIFSTSCFIWLNCSVVKLSDPSKAKTRSRTGIASAKIKKKIQLDSE